MPLLPLLGLIFIVLKLTNVIAWSWLWVLAPFWGGFILWVALFSLILWVKVKEQNSPYYFLKNMRGK